MGRNWYELSDWLLEVQGRCPSCGTRCAGAFARRPAAAWGRSACRSG